MNTQEQMQLVDETIGDICVKLGTLTRDGVLSHEDSMEIIRLLNGKHLRWMQSRFSYTEISKFLYSKE